MGGNAVGLEPYQVADLEGPAGAVQMTAVAAHHGSPEMFERNGPVLSFVLRGDDLPTIYVSGDNASVDVVSEITTQHVPFERRSSSPGAPRCRSGERRRAADARR